MSGDKPEPKESTWRGWLVIGPSLVIAAALLIITLAPHDAPSPTPPGGSSTPTAADQHEVATDEGVVSFRFEDGAIVIRLARNGSTSELGRTPLASLSGTALFAMVCGPADGPTSRRYFFGHVDSAHEAEYAGPEAVGHVASDGLFLFALLPAPAGSEVPVEIQSGQNGPGGGFGPLIFARAIGEGQRQPSGCFVVR
jgi:hypothetical protein